ncbi:MAG TPA: hypothetical protein VJO99_26260 [Burkholderiaceae bacterium]|nr:hypothetical protein [Burkholderiaceae bacterium]
MASPTASLHASHLHHVPPPAARAQAKVRRDWGRIALQYTPILAVVLLAKIAVPPFGKIGLGIDLPILLAVMLLGLCMGRFQVHVTRLLFYLLTIGWLGGSQLLLDNPFSPSSIAFLAVLFLPLTLQLRPPKTRPLDPPAAEDPLQASLRAMAGLAAFFALLGVLQYTLQYVIGQRLAYPIEHSLPEAFITQKYNHLIPIREGGMILKANGVFFLEPSFYSQFIGLGLVLELSTRNRPLRIALLVAGLAVAYSGTGIIVASVGIAGLVIVKRRWDVIVFVVLAALAALLLSDLLHLDRLLNRVAEFQSTRSSASARFVAWLDMLHQHWWLDGMRALFGAGAGSFSSYAVTARLATAEMSFSKMLFEYGIVGATLFFGFLAYVLNSMPAPLAFRLGLCASLFLNGAFATFPIGIAASILLWPAGRTTGGELVPPRPTPRREPRFDPRFTPRFDPHFGGPP